MVIQRLAPGRLTVAQVITRLDLGGAQRHVLDLLRGLDPLRYRRLLITGPSGAMDGEADAIPGVERHNLPELSRNIHPLRDLQTMIHLRRLFIRERVDIVHTHSSKAGIVGRFAARWAGVPMVFHTIHGFGVYAGAEPTRRLFRYAERLAAPLADRLIAVSDRTRQEGLAMGIGRCRQYVTISYRIDGAPFAVPSDRRRPARDSVFLDGAPTVGMIACLKPQKAPHDFVRVARLVHQELPTARFLLIGDGELRTSLEAEIKAQGLATCCMLLGWRRDVPDLLAAMDVLVLTSRWEGLPIAVLEAMAAGKPVVAMDAGGVAEAVEDGVTGYVVRGRAIQTMAERVLTILRSPTFGATMGQQGYRRFQERFSGLSSMVSQIEALYQEVWRAR